MGSWTFTKSVQLTEYIKIRHCYGKSTIFEFQTSNAPRVLALRVGLLGELMGSDGFVTAINGCELEFILVLPLEHVVKSKLNFPYVRADFSPVVTAYACSVGFHVTRRFSRDFECYGDMPSLLTYYIMRVLFSATLKELKGT